MTRLGRVTVLIPTYRRAGSLVKTLESVELAAPADGDLSVVVVDNGVDEETRRAVEGRRWRLPTRLVECRTRGKSAALNAGLAAIPDGFVVFLDDDVLLDDRYFEELEDGLDRWPGVAGYGGLVTADFSECRESNLGPLTIAHVRGYAFGTNDHGRVEGVYEDGHPVGNSMGFRRDCLPTGDVFDPETGPAATGYRMGSGARLFEWLRTQERRIVFLPMVTARHVLRPEQVTVAWLMQRSFSFGRSLAHMGYRYRGIDPRRGVAVMLVAWFRALVQSVWFALRGKSDPGAVARVKRRTVEGIFFERCFGKRV